MMLPALKDRIPELELKQPVERAEQTILSPEALSFIAALVEKFAPPLAELLQQRKQRQQAFDQGDSPDFLAATDAIRQSDWQVAPIPEEVLDRRTEITGPVSRKMVINALNSGAQVYMADLEDSTAPTWRNVIDAQVNLYDAVRGTIQHQNPSGKTYQLDAEIALLMVRPRGLHLPERHVHLAGKPIPAALLDFGLFLFHNHQALSKQNRRAYFYLPKLQDYREAEWWNQVIDWAEKRLCLSSGFVRVTVLIETLPAVFQMDEILHALRDRILGLNCGRWDYIFSYIKTFRTDPRRILPNREQVTMLTPFLRSYSQLLIHTCHRRGAFAMGGMAAQIPIKNDPDKNRAAMEKVRADKAREAADGHDGTWVAHPGLEALARAEFDRVLDGPNQINLPSDPLVVSAADLTAAVQGQISQAGVESNIRVATEYLAAWLAGQGCVPIDHLMEDAATAEISRAQLWQWLHHRVCLSDGQELTDALFLELHRAVLDDLKAAYSEDRMGCLEQAGKLIEQLTLAESLCEFITLPAYELLDD